MNSDAFAFRHHISFTQLVTHSQTDSFGIAQETSSAKMSALSISSSEEEEAKQPPSSSLMETLVSELKLQRRIALPMVAMNMAWFAKTAINTAFLGRLGDLNLAGGALGFTFANVTGFSVLNGLSGAMEPICGQAYGAGNFKLLHKTLLMTTVLLILVTIPISFLWLNVDKILLLFGQQNDISIAAKNVVSYLLPDLLAYSFLCPLKSYLNSQNITLPTLFCSSLALAFHLPINMILSRSMGIKGISMTVWITDLILPFLLAVYVIILENRQEKTRWTTEEGGGWWDQSIKDWIRLIKLTGSCCLNTCLEWWCYEILVLISGHLQNPEESLSVITIVFNLDFLPFTVMLSLATCVSIRVSNELRANRPSQANRSARVSLGLAMICGVMASLAMVCGRGIWGKLFSHDKGIIKGVKKMMLVMAMVEVVNFPLAVCGGIVRGTARPWLGMYANVGGFYAVALPLGVVFAFNLGMGLLGLFLGLLIGICMCLVMLVVFVVRINWVEDARKAHSLASNQTSQPIHDVALQNGQL